MLCISTSKRMLARAFAWSKTIKNTRKLVKKVPFASCAREACKAHEEKQRKTKKKFVGQRLGVTPKSCLTHKHWLLIWKFVVFVLREPLVRMMKKVLFTHFRVFSIVFDHADACAVEIHNTCIFHIIFQIWCYAAVFYGVLLRISPAIFLQLKIQLETLRFEPWTFPLPTELFWLDSKLNF